MQGLEEGSNEERTRTGITNSLKTKLADLMRDFSALRNNITSHYRDVVDRRYEIVTGEKASEDQLDQLIETGEAENLFQKAILSQGRGKVCTRSCIGSLLVKEFLSCGACMTESQSSIA
jgi:syntaxin 1B/2/3